MKKLLASFQLLKNIAFLCSSITETVKKIALHCSQNEKEFSTACNIFHTILNIMKLICIHEVQKKNIILLIQYVLPRIFIIQLQDYTKEFRYVTV